ncbi:fanconi anemia-associated protein of 24 kda-like [Plakobranchus ocellatus]|uniref:Fanconi anemia-associated protein of 24 kDa-like n=1 Tax=Plakobranchus ocellatus TaxID=259542 RepID=A0AAV4AIN5_9GAST|nr:fanconi anemia-associated protein of 24 kda-like [Plakobranchus ocellatus]
MSTQTVGINVPVGHIVANSRWTSSKLVTELQALIPVHFDNSTSAIDFYPSCNVGVIFLSEADVVEGCAYKRRAARLRKANNVRGTVVVEKTATSTQYFLDLQKFCVGNLGLDLIPVKNQSEAAAFLVQMVYAEGKLGSNPFKKELHRPPSDPAVLAAVMSCRGVGLASATVLLENFPSLESICKASLEELAVVIGKSSATKLYQFLHGIT